MGATRNLSIMKPFMTRVYDRLESATLHFARSGGIRERLEGAWRQWLSKIEPEDIPREMRLQFLDLSARIQRERPLRGEDALKATIRKMSNDEAEQHATVIVRMFCRMTRQQELELGLPAATSAAVVQLFAAEG
jgi:hypothetical protein